MRMADEVRETVQGDGYAVGSLDGMGEGYGFRKVRRALDVTEFGVNAIVMPEGYDTPVHYHDEQQEVYFVHQGRIEISFGEDGSEKFLLGPGGLARVDAHTVRTVRNPGPGDCVYYVVGGKGGYIGRDGRPPGGGDMARRPASN
jgi:mannose-6-phosphate isomerase-like protein (cupin superfamily)